MVKLVLCKFNKWDYNFYEINFRVYDNKRFNMLGGKVLLKIGLIGFKAGTDLIKIR